MSGAGLYQTNLPNSNTPLVDPETGIIKQNWLIFLMVLWNRTGGGQIVNLVNIIQQSELGLIGDSEDARGIGADASLALTLSDACVTPKIDQALLIGDPEPTPKLNAFSMDTLEDFLSGFRAPLPPHPGYVSGLNYAAFDGMASATGVVGGVDNLYLYPFYIADNISVDQLFLRVVTTAAGSAKAGVWLSHRGRPVGSPLVADNTGISVNTSGIRQFAITTTRLARGWYWWGTKFTGSLPVCLNIPGTAMLTSSRIGLPTPDNALLNGATNQSSGLVVADAYANPLPNLNGASFNPVTGASAGIPVLGFRVAP